MMKRNISYAGEARTGPVNLALWWAAMTRGFTGHKPRGMRETRKWPTVSIFCQAASTHLFSPLCVCLPLSFSDYHILFCNSDFQLGSYCLTLFSSLFVFMRLYTHQELQHLHHVCQVQMKVHETLSLMVRINVCWDQSWNFNYTTHSPHTETHTILWLLVEHF